jgi:hypothetical protein
VIFCLSVVYLFTVVIDKKSLVFVYFSLLMTSSISVVFSVL